MTLSDLDDIDQPWNMVKKTNFKGLPNRGGYQRGRGGRGAYQNGPPPTYSNYNDYPQQNRGGRNNSAKGKGKSTFQQRDAAKPVNDQERYFLEGFRAGKAAGN